MFLRVRLKIQSLIHCFDVRSRKTPRAVQMRIHTSSIALFIYNKLNKNFRAKSAARIYYNIKYNCLAFPIRFFAVRICSLDALVSRKSFQSLPPKQLFVERLTLKFERQLGY